MEFVDVTVYYLEMQTPISRQPIQSREGLTVLYVHRPSVSYYRWLYNSVGSKYHWLSRRQLSDKELATILNHPLSDIYVLHVDGSPAGFCEFDRRQPQEIELVQFGLLEAYHGAGLGTWFLRYILNQACQHAPERLWLHTCTLDHPAALPLYRKVGFTDYQQQQIRREL